jgi:RNA recognition motif-containing protein
MWLLMSDGYAKKDVVATCWDWHFLQQGDGAVRRREDARRSITKHRPTKTLFVVNFDPIETRVRDLERHFEPYGKLVRVHIHKNFGFVQYETQEEATKALESTNMRWVPQHGVCSPIVWACISATLVIVCNAGYPVYEWQPASLEYLLY